MRDPSLTVVLGPLAPFADGFVVELSAQGYTAGSAVQQMCLMAHLSRWLEAEGLGPAALSPAVVERFCQRASRRGLHELALLTGVGFAAGLSAAAGCGAGGETSVSDGPAEELLAVFGGISRSSVGWWRDPRGSTSIGSGRSWRGVVDEDGLDLARVGRRGGASVRGRVLRGTLAAHDGGAGRGVAGAAALLYFEGELPGSWSTRCRRSRRGGCRGAAAA